MKLFNTMKYKAGAASVAAVAIISLAPAGASASCPSKSGGVTADNASCEATPPPKGRIAKLVNGKAIAPAAAPAEVKAVIAAANRIDSKPYIYGGGHGKWEDAGYDCSGAVSYALHGGGMLDSPMPSGGFMTWDRPGLGKWITTFANGGHMYAVIAGLRWDTSMTPGDGPGWSKQMRSPAGSVARHPAGF